MVIFCIVWKIKGYIETRKLHHQLEKIRQDNQKTWWKDMKKSEIDSNEIKPKKKIYDENWFNKKWIHKITKTLYDENWFDKNWFNKKWIHKITNTKLDELWFDKNWINGDTWTKYSIYHFDINWINEFTGTEYDEEWFNQDWWDKDGYDREWFNNNWYDRDWYDKRWFDKSWYNREWFRKSWYNREWFNKYWWDRDWFNKEWYDEDWFNRSWYDKNWRTRERYVPNLDLEWKHILFFDTETTGKNENRDDQILQFAWIYWVMRNWEFKEEKRINQYINVTKPIGQGAYETHHISKDFLEEYGYIEDYLKEIMNYFHDADLVIGHNVIFDLTMMEQEAKRSWVDFPPKRYFDTMHETTDLLRIPRYDWTYKWPKLIELYRFLFNKGFDDAHDAMADIDATKNCFIELYKLRYFDKTKIKTYPLRERRSYKIHDGAIFYTDEYHEEEHPVDDWSADYVQEYDHYESDDPDEIIAWWYSEWNYNQFYHWPDYDNYDEE